MALPTRRDYMSSMARADCGICLQPLTQSMSTTCRHYFCRGCIRTWLRSNNTCPTCRAELFDEVVSRTGRREPARPDQPRRELDEGAPAVAGQRPRLQTRREILERLRALRLAVGELEHQELLSNVVRGSSSAASQRRGAAGSQAVRESQNTQADHEISVLGPQRRVNSEDLVKESTVGIPESSRAVNPLLNQSVHESTPTMSQLQRIERPLPTRDYFAEHQHDRDLVVMERQTTSSGVQSAHRSQRIEELTHDEISALYTQLGVDRSRILVCNSTAMFRLMERLQSVQHARPDWHNQISDLDVLYTFEITGDLFKFTRISYDWPSWYDRVPSRNDRQELIDAFFGHRREWKGKVASYLRGITPDRLDSEVRRLKQEETGDPLRERIFKHDVWF